MKQGQMCSGDSPDSLGVGYQKSLTEQLLNVIEPPLSWASKYLACSTGCSRMIGAGTTVSVVWSVVVIARTDIRIGPIEVDLLAVKIFERAAAE
jgi:hypothetical protein